MRILITRPREDAAALAAKLAAAGHEVLSEPLLEILPVAGATVDLDRVQAILFTSANGVRALAAIERRRDLPVLAVGDSTAAAARAAGFARVESAGGKVGDLAALARQRFKPEDGALLHAAGRDRAGDLAGALTSAGYEVRQPILYTAEPVPALSPATASALGTGQVDLVIVYSRRTAKTFRRLVEQAGLSAALSRVKALAISPAAVEPIATLGWAKIDAASRPDEAELLKLVEQTAVRPAGPPKADAADERPAGGRRATRAATGGRFMAPMVWLAVLLSIGTFVLLLIQPSRPLPDAAGPSALRLDSRLTALERQVAALSRDAGQAADADVDARLKRLDERLKTLEARPEPSGGLSEEDASRLASLERRAGDSPALDDVVKRLDAVEAALAKRPDAGDLAAVMAENRRLAADLARIQEQVAALDAARARSVSREALLLAAGQLALAAARGEPVVTEVATLRDLAGDEPRLAAALTGLPAQLDRPVPTADTLAARFRDLAPHAIRAASRADAQTGGSALDAWWRGVLQRLSEAVTIRRVGDVQGDGPDARIARAEQHLAARDLKGAVAALDGLSGPAADDLASWLADAKARLALDRAVDAVSAAAIAAIAPTR